MKFNSLIIAVLFILFFASGCAKTESTLKETINLNDSSNDVSLSSAESSRSENKQKQSSQQDDNVNLPEKYQINNFPVIYQLPELPTGCEITALTMALNYYGLNADKVIMATQYLPTSDYYIYYKDSRPIGNDLDNYFLGDPTNSNGYVCGIGALVTAANNYLKACNSNLTAKDMTGSSPKELYELVAQDTPVVVLTTIEMKDRYVAEGWYTENGKYVDWSRSDHGTVLIGYTDDTVTIADPLLGEVQYSKAQFEKVLASRGNKCMILQANE